MRCFGQLIMSVKKPLAMALDAQACHLHVP